MTPLEYYQEQCRQGTIVEDSQQLAVMHELQRIYLDLIREHQKRRGVLSIFHQFKMIKGLYLWGGVGIGKTFMMDCFYKCLPFPEKMRMHFHQFMKLIHEELKKY